MNVVRTIVIEARAAAAPAAPIPLLLSTTLGRVFAALRGVALLEGVGSLEHEIEAMESVEERNLALVWFYRDQVLTKLEAEQIVEIADLFEGLLGSPLDGWLTRVELLDQAMRAEEGAERALRTIVATREAGLGAVEEEFGRLVEQLIGNADEGERIGEVLAGAALQVADRADAANGEVAAVDRVVVTQLRQWEEVARQVERFSGGQ